MKMASTLDSLKSRAVTYSPPKFDGNPFPRRSSTQIISIGQSILALLKAQFIYRISSLFFPLAKGIFLEVRL